MENKLRDIIKYSDITVIVDDFLEVVECLIELNVVKGRNIAKYKYYILRLASGWKIKLVNHLDDMKDGDTKDRFDDALFGAVYPKLKWDKGFVASYYSEWLSKNKKQGKF